jgi:hypothetical protein
VPHDLDRKRAAEERCYHSELGHIPIHGSSGRSRRDPDVYGGEGLYTGEDGRLNLSFTRFQLALLTIAVCLAAMCLGRLTQIGLSQLASAAHVAVYADD